MSSRRGTPGRVTALLATAALSVAAGCGGEERQGTTVASPSDAESSYRDDLCDRRNASRLKRFHVTDDGFRPGKTVVKAGVPVTFINCGDKPHTVTKSSGPGKDFDSGTLQPREKYEITLASLGTVRFIDRHNPGPRMTIEVTGQPNEPQN